MENKTLGQMFAEILAPQYQALGVSSATEQSLQKLFARLDEPSEPVQPKQISVSDLAEQATRTDYLDAALVEVDIESLVCDPSDDRDPDPFATKHAGTANLGILPDEEF